LTQRLKPALKRSSYRSAEALRHQKSKLAIRSKYGIEFSRRLLV
jgi:hypothetical protein